MARPEEPEAFRTDLVEQFRSELRDRINRDRPPRILSAVLLALRDHPHELGCGRLDRGDGHRGAAARRTAISKIRIDRRESEVGTSIARRHFHRVAGAVYLWGRPASGRVTWSSKARPLNPERCADCARHRGVAGHHRPECAGRVHQVHAGRPDACGRRALGDAHRQGPRTSWVVSGDHKQLDIGPRGPTDGCRERRVRLHRLEAATRVAVVKERAAHRRQCCQLRGETESGVRRTGVGRDGTRRGPGP